MKYYFFYAENNNFNDVLNDKIIKKHLSTRIAYYQYLILGFDESIPESILAYMFVKYGEQIKPTTNIIPDRKPIPNKDYKPDKKWMKDRFVDN